MLAGTSDDYFVMHKNFKFRISNFESNSNELILKRDLEIESLKIHLKFKIRNSKFKQNFSIVLKKTANCNIRSI